ncbi:MAG: phosphoribosylformylglycinamidine cyclo-ligase [Acidimicrobiia bacterium]|nr:phosphoribosylformylglycinamidine cyclo-ligase [Acidimicrobiia bacterium]
MGARIAGQTDTEGSPVALPWQSSYADAGVDIAAGNRAVEMMERDVRSTYTDDVIAGIGAFGGMFDAAELGADPVLVASTDGVGTKTKIATAMGRYDTIGHDIVNHCVNDILVQGARPLFFLDYIATSSLDPLIAAAVVSGMATACRLAGCVLLGGETAEMPGVYVADEIDVVGTIVGVVERDQIIDPTQVAAGDVVLAIKSTGLHTNGYSLARHVFEHWDLDDRVAALGTSLGNALLEPHRSYLAEITRLRETGIPIRALVHITGGGLIENPGRVLPSTLALRLHLDSWRIPPLFALIQSQGNIAAGEMFRTFNMGVGMLVVVAAERARDAIDALGSDAWVIGEVIPRETDEVVMQ